MDNVLFPMRKFCRNTVLHVMGAFSVPSNGIHILNGHRIENELEPETFRKQLKELSKDVEFIRFEKAVQMIKRKEKPTKAYVAFSFDDGFMECYDVFAPVLEEFGINCMCFINPNYVEGDEKYIQNFNKHVVLTPDRRPMRWEHIEELHKRGHLIGAHTMDHYMINSNDIETLHYQIVKCKTSIENRLGVDCDYFAFPYGRLEHANVEAIKIATENYKYVFSQSDYKHYFSFDGKVINRRHFEPFWPVAHVKYFISCKKK